MIDICQASGSVGRQRIAEQSFRYTPSGVSMEMSASRVLTLVREQATDSPTFFTRKDRWRKSAT